MNFFFGLDRIKFNKLIFKTWFLNFTNYGHADILDDSVSKKKLI